jgi:acetyl coenzyme A synthetase (ADP forming)-like protein
MTESAGMHALLAPSRVAVIGASRNPASLGRRIFDALIAGGFAGDIYPVNPAADEVGGRPAVRRIGDLPRGVDLAVIAVPRDCVLAAVEDAIAAGVRALCVITAGFAETGTAGRALQRQLVSRVRAAGIRMVGPNCLGIINPASALNASFSPVFPSAGHVALSSQSGALGLTILELARERGIGISTFVSVGNKADVSSNDLLEYWAGDPHTNVITLYLESFGNPRRFAEIARAVGRTKPIVAVKSGRTRAGGRAATSHTAALAASDAVVDALFQGSGGIRADPIDEMFDIASCLELQPLPSGRRVAIVTNAGGPGILAVDACERAGLVVTEFSEPTRAELASFLPASASLGNPVDMVASADAEQYRRTVKTTLCAGDADGLIVIYTPVDPSHSAAIVRGITDGVIAARAAGCRKPVLACLQTAGLRPAPVAAGAERLPNYVFPESAARALAKVTTYAEWRSRPVPASCRWEDVRLEQTRHLCQQVIGARGNDWLTGEELQRVLGAYGITFITPAFADTADGAVDAAHTFGYPVVAKVMTTGASHKTDFDGVRVDVRSDDDLRRACATLKASAERHLVPFGGFWIQPMIQGGVELMVGLAHDSLFGPVIGFGRGGTDVEIERDVHFRLVPITGQDADELLRESRAWPRLTGFRGRAASDVAALRELLQRVSQLAAEVPEILEMDLNPVIALPSGLGYAAVDARVKVGRAPAGIS